VVAIIGQPDGIVRRHEHAVRARKQTFAERAEEAAVAVEHDHRMLAAIENVDIVVLIDADAADFLKRPARRRLRPVLDRFVGVGAVADDSRARNLVRYQCAHVRTTRAKDHAQITS
jgi:glyoxylate carboligase